MNKLMTYEGGQPLYLDDIRFLQEAISESMSAIIIGLKKTGYMILQGCNVSHDIDRDDGRDKKTWTEGWLALAGEIFRVEAGSIYVDDYTSPVYWCSHTYESADSNYLFENGARKSTHQIRKATLRTSPGDAEKWILHSEIEKIEERLFDKLEGRFILSSVKESITLLNAPSSLRGGIERYTIEGNKQIYNINIRLNSDVSLTDVSLYTGVKKLCDLDPVFECGGFGFALYINKPRLSKHSYSTYAIRLGHSLQIFNLNGTSPDTLPEGELIATIINVG